MSEYFDATDLDQWAERRDAQGTLPQLVRRLILETADIVHLLQFRSDEGVQLGGWDGIAEVSGIERLVPNGLSVWETGTSADARAKAEGDYQNRLLDPLGIDPAEATYVAVTARRFPTKQEWTNSKADGPWKAVLALDADDLATWLDDAPATDAWIATKLGRDPETLEPLTLWWETWRRATNPELKGHFVLAGRDAASAALLEALGGAPGTVVLASDSIDEGLAFIAASLERDATPDGEQQFVRTLVVHEPLGWRRAVASPRSRVLIPLFEGADVAGALGAGHHVIVVQGRVRGAGEDVLDIGRIRREPAREALMAMGLPTDEADRLAGTARGSLMSLRRSLAIAGTVRTPPWAQGEAAQSLLPVLLAGSWHDQVAGDRDVLARLADAPYEEFIRHVGRWASEGDPPVRLVGSVWRVISTEDIWRLLGGQITAEDLRRFQGMCRDVFLSVDPALELPVDERWMAGVRGAVRPHSESLRRGLANSLALLGARFGDRTFPGGSTGQEIATSIVRAILDAANQDTSGNLWASNSDVLLQYAESAPDAFLGAVETGSAGDTPVLAWLFTDAQGTSPMIVGSPHTGLLWALETLAWSREYLGRVTRVLARLIRIDPGGTLTNRPSRSLIEIYKPWHPQTSATLAERFEVIDSVLEHEPAGMRALLIDLLPSGHDSAIGTQRPLWVYIGKVTWAGVEYEGQHEPLVSEALFERVQEIFRAHDRAGIRRRRHPHYLRGTVHCAACGARLSSMVVKRQQYEYFYCVGRHTKRTNCDAPYLAAADLEGQVTILRKDLQLTNSRAAAIGKELGRALKSREAKRAQMQEALTQALSGLESQREKLLKAYYADAITLDQLKTEQHRIEADVSRAKHQLSLTAEHLEAAGRLIAAALNMASHLHGAYTAASPATRQRLNQAVFTAIWVENRAIVGQEYEWAFGFMPKAHSSSSNKERQVELTGFEPVTPSLRKMWSEPSDQGKRYAFLGLWGGCGSSDVRPSQLW